MTVMTSDTNGIHEILSNPDTRKDHIHAIVSMVKKENMTALILIMKVRKLGNQGILLIVSQRTQSRTRQ